MDYEIANPHPAGTIESLRSLGYSTEAAVADLVDNSIAADARQVDVVFTWDGRDSWVAVIDDGRGMTETELVTAMTIAARGPGAARDRAGSGPVRHGAEDGLVLPGAPAHRDQRRRREAAAPPGSGTSTWSSGRSNGGFCRALSPADSALLDSLWAGHGTVVLWRHLHRFDLPGLTADDVGTQRHFYDEIRRVETHLGMVFARFLAGQRGLKLNVNGNPVQPWDPFLQQPPLRPALARRGDPDQRAHDARSPASFFRTCATSATRKPGRPPGPADGWSSRASTCIGGTGSSWPGTGSASGASARRTSTSWPGLAVDIPAELDPEWSIDVRKSAAVPPLAARPHLQRIGAAARRAAAAVLSHRGRVTARERGADFVYAWTVQPQQRPGHLPREPQAPAGQAGTARRNRGIRRRRRADQAAGGNRPGRRAAGHAPGGHHRRS